jgi:hypothetical protein
MAILKGFPPSNTISPSVRISEQDLSFITPVSASSAVAGLVGFASKGPINIPTVVTTGRQLSTVFGNPHPELGDPYMVYAAQQFLLTGTQCFCVRVADTDPVSDEAARTASTPVPAAGGQLLVWSSTPGPYVFADNQFFRFRLNGTLNFRTLVALQTGAFGISAEELATELNEQIDAENDGIAFFAHSDGLGDTYVGVKTLWAFGPDAELEFVAVQNSMYGFGGVTGLGSGMTQAALIGDEDRYPATSYSAGNYDLSGETGLFLNVVIDGTDNVSLDNVVQVIDLSGLEGDATLSAADVVDYVNDVALDDLPGGFEAYAVGDQVALRTLHSGRDARLLVKSDSTAAAVFGFGHETALGTSPRGTAASTQEEVVTGLETFGRANGSANSANVSSFTALADTPGVDGNATQIKITNDVHASVFTLEVYNNGSQVESWGNLTKNPASRFYVETYLQLVSDFVRVTDNPDTTAPPADGTYLLGDPGVAGSIAGTDGIPSDPDKQDALLVGSAVGFTGLYALSEPEQVQVDLLAVPGHSSTFVVQSLLDVCQNYRQDSLALIDPPFGLTVSEIVAWQNGAHPLNSQRFDSDFGALYWPWVKVRDTYNQVDVWCPPSGAVMATIARSDSLSAPWFAPAGITRGLVPGVTDVFSRPTQQERDQMYANRNCVNPIIQFVDVGGFVLWGQKTLQRLPSALDRVNVRRMMFTIEKRIRSMSRGLLFDPNDSIFRAEFSRMATDILTVVKIGRGLTDFIIDAGEDLNTPDVIDRNEFRANIGVQPTRAVEFMFIQFSIHRTGSFTETASNF